MDGTQLTEREKEWLRAPVAWGGTEWHPTKALGSGSYATVFYAEPRTAGGGASTGQPLLVPVAIKCTLTARLTAWSRRQLEEEQRLWSQLQHPHIVRLLGSSVESHRHVLLMELCHGGELFTRRGSLGVERHALLCPFCA